VAGIQPQIVLTIDPKHRLVEGVASDGTTIWVSSILDRQILACRTACRTIATLPAGLHPFAIAWDQNRKRLWVAADCPPGVAGIKPCERGALIAMTTGGKIMTRMTPLTGSFHPGDVSVAPGGVFVSDSQNGAVYGFGKSGYSLVPVIKPGVGKSAQGTTLDADGKRLLVADYSQGVGAIDLATRSRTILLRQDGKPIRGIDGLTRCGATYFGIYNGSAPGSLIEVTPDETSLTLEQPLAEGSLPDPTQIAYDGKRLLIVADSGWATIDKPDFTRTTGAPIVSVPLSDDCKPQ
jgi:DNA-binding beta-propeller fold protein YncE